MNRVRLCRGLTLGQSYEHLRGRLDSEAMLEDLGIDVGYRLGKSQVMCHCPNLTGNHLYGDRNPSFGFNEEKLIFNCFTCGGGNVIELVQMMKPGTSNDEAVRYLESFSDLAPASKEDLMAKVQSILHPEEEESMPEYPDDALFRYRKIHPYLYERGLTKDVIVEMQVGFDEQHCGIIIPHFFQGKLRGWQVRHLAQNNSGAYLCDYCEEESGQSMMKFKKVGKYTNTRRFPKSNTLYGYDRLKKKRVESQLVAQHKRTEGVFIHSINSVIVVESPMTALKLMSMGFDNVVSSFGQFSAEQGMLLLPFNRVIFWPDADRAGYENVRRCIDSIGRYTSVVIVPVIDKIKGDAGDLSDVTEVQEYLAAAYPVALFEMLAKEKLPNLQEVKNAIEDKQANINSVEA